MGSGKNDNIARNKIKNKLKRWGMDPAEIELCMDQIRQRQRLKRNGKLPLDAPLCTRAEYARLLKKQIHVNDRRPTILTLGDDYEPLNDKKYKPTRVDPVLRGTARAVGTAAKAVNRKKTYTKFEYDQENS